MLMQLLTLGSIFLIISSENIMVAVNPIGENNTSVSLTAPTHLCSVQSVYLPWIYRQTLIFL